jgi:hypothetical protein
MLRRHGWWHRISRRRAPRARRSRAPVVDVGWLCLRQRRPRSPGERSALPRSALPRAAAGGSRGLRRADRGPARSTTGRRLGADLAAAPHARRALGAPRARDDRRPPARCAAAVRARDGDRRRSATQGRDPAGHTAPARSPRLPRGAADRTLHARDARAADHRARPRGDRRHARHAVRPQLRAVGRYAGLPRAAADPRALRPHAPRRARPGAGRAGPQQRDALGSAARRPLRADALQARGITSLYSHQREAADLLHAGATSWSRPRPRRASRSATTCRCSTRCCARPRARAALPVPDEGAGARPDGRARAAAARDRPPGAT